MPRFIACAQGSPEWHMARAGYATASRFADIMEGGARREAYLYELVAQRMAGPMRDSGGQAKDWGHEAEPLARKLYRSRTGNLVEQVGFAVHSRIKWVGASSDGIVIPHRKGGIEIKSPFNSGIHARTLLKGMPDVHGWQTIGNHWVFDFDWIDFLSFDPSFKAPHDLYIETVKRDDRAIKDLTHHVKEFLAEVHVAHQDIANTTR